MATPWTPFSENLIDLCRRERARPCLFFFQSKSPQYRGTVLFGYIEARHVPGSTWCTPGGDPAGVTPSHFTLCFDDDFTAPDEQAAADAAVAQACNNPGCTYHGDCRARAAAALAAVRAAGPPDGPIQVAPPALEASAARIAAALEKIGESWNTAWKEKV